MARFARALPLLSAATVTAQRLQELGLWSPEACAAAEALQARAAGAPRYYAGRRVMLPGGRRAFGTLRSIDAVAESAIVQVRPLT